jgi:hypothetical protein
MQTTTTLNGKFCKITSAVSGPAMAVIAGYHTNSSWNSRASGFPRPMAGYCSVCKMGND